ncbi:hypothetical protein BGZ79_006554, partial [Entomortierella chlamydospora]
GFSAWERGDRGSFVQHLIGNGCSAVLYNTEADVQISADCLPDNTIVSGDSDFLFYKSVAALWRPIGKHAVCEVLGLRNEGLVALAVVSRNDYANLGYFDG